MDEFGLYIVTCALMSGAGLLIVGASFLVALLSEEAAGWVFLLGLMCVCMGPLMLIGAPA